MTNREYHGAATLEDGTRVALSADEAKALWEQAEAIRNKADADMPTTHHALGAISTAKDRLRRFGWSDGVHCPKDGSEFAVIEFGSTGIFSAFYSGTWPDGFLNYAGCVGRPGNMMWKPIASLTADELKTMHQCDESTRKWIERDMRTFASMMDENAHD